jgi:GntR family transcriptional repressor for pyruvate dehydrogenase complex
MLKAVTRDVSLTARAERQLEDLIVQGSVQPGERLPSENDMARELGVSRTVVREAVRLLTARGLVEARNGSGIYVRALGAELVRGPMDLLLRARGLTGEQLLEVREGIEVQVARLAAERATAADIVALEKAVAVQREPSTTAAQSVEADLAFHHGLARATHNPLFEALSDALARAMTDFLRTVVARHGSTAREHAATDHGRTLERIKARDPEGAARQMAAELAKARRLLGPSRASVRRRPRES